MTFLNEKRSHYKVFSILGLYFGVPAVIFTEASYESRNSCEFHVTVTGEYMDLYIQVFTTWKCIFLYFSEQIYLLLQWNELMQLVRGNIYPKGTKEVESKLHSFYKIPSYKIWTNVAHKG